MKNAIALILLASTLSGCAGLTARKVPLSKRLSGTDNRVNGFRYYLSRPYIVVSKRVPIVEYQEMGYLVAGKFSNAKGKTRDLVGIISFDGDSKVVLNLAGEVIGGEELAAGMHPLVQSDEPQARNAMQSMNFSNTSLLEEAQPKDSGPLPTNYAPGTRAISTRADGENTTGGEEKPFEVVFLPDFEEQMAIKHNNFLASGKFTLAFADGWQLQNVNGNFDSTEVAIRLFQSVQNAIGQAKTLEEARFNASKKGAGGPSSLSVQSPESKQVQKVVITRKVYIEPGMYRIAKGHEMADASCGFGFLEEIGVPVVTETQVAPLMVEAKTTETTKEAAEKAAAERAAAEREKTGTKTAAPPKEEPVDTPEPDEKKMIFTPTDRPIQLNQP